MHLALDAQSYGSSGYHKIPVGEQFLGFGAPNSEAASGWSTNRQMNPDLNMPVASALCILTPCYRRPPNCSGAERSRCTRGPAQKSPIGDVTEIQTCMPIVPLHSVFSHLIASAPPTVLEPGDRVVPESQHKKNPIGNVTESVKDFVVEEGLKKERNACLFKVVAANIL
ncbi:hypothetical protein B0H13DRAFT_1905591 [Mycena leptocephala]|nr:hypothetical protein B0H13DRAFT_1905591 [Mycena leptocephala]